MCLVQNVKDCFREHGELTKLVEDQIAEIERLRNENDELNLSRNKYLDRATEYKHQLDSYRDIDQRCLLLQKAVVARDAQAATLSFDNRKLQRENGLLKAIAAQAEKVYRLRLTIPDESTIPIYGEIVAMGTMIFYYEREHSK